MYVWLTRAKKFPLSIYTNFRSWLEKNATGITTTKKKRLPLLPSSSSSSSRRVSLWTEREKTKETSLRTKLFFTKEPQKRAKQQKEVLTQKKKKKSKKWSLRMREKRATRGDLFLRFLASCFFLLLSSYSFEREIFCTKAELRQDKIVISHSNSECCRRTRWRTHQLLADLYILLLKRIRRARIIMGWADVYE